MSTFTARGVGVGGSGGGRSDHHPTMTDDPEGGQAHLLVQAQNNENRIIAPSSFTEIAFAPPPWW